MPPVRKKLGDILLEMGSIDALQLRSALAHQDQWGVPLGKALVEKNFCTVEDVMRALSLETGHPLIDLDAEPLDPALAFTVPVKSAEAHRVVPLRLEGKRKEILLIAAAAPATLETVDAVRSVSRKPQVVVRLAADEAIDRAIKQLYYGRPRDQAPAPVVPVLAVQVENEATFEAVDLKPMPNGAEPDPPVLLYGWNDARQKAVAAMLGQGGFETRSIDDSQVLDCREEDVVITSTLSLQTILPAGSKPPRGHFIICGLAQDADVSDARAVGARMYLRPPFSPEKLGDAIRRCREKRRAP